MYFYTFIKKVYTKPNKCIILSIIIITLTFLCITQNNSFVVLYSVWAAMQQVYKAYGSLPEEIWCRSKRKKLFIHLFPHNGIISSLLLARRDNLVEIQNIEQLLNHDMCKGKSSGDIPKVILLSNTILYNVMFTDLAILNSWCRMLNIEITTT